MSWTTTNVDARHSTIYHSGRDQHININSAGQNLVKLSILLGSEPTTNTVASIRSECLAGTRQDLLETIKQWIYMIPERVFWLHGLAGSGKSAISTTVADILRRHGLLGALLFCNRDISERSEPSNVIRNIAFQLALFDPQICDRIMAAIKNASNIAESPLRWQFDTLLVEPLLSLPAGHPIVIILDALDECGDPKSRADLMDLLANESMRLPAFIRIIVTSRGESDIRRAFTQPHVIAHEINIASIDNCEDILSFVGHQMKAIRTKRPLLYLPYDWPGDTAVRALAERASGLFVWAVTACRFMDTHNPQKQLDILLRADVNSKPQLALDNLYNTALKATGILDDEEFCSDFRAIMGTILVARNPISYRTIDTLLCLDNPSSKRPSSLYTIDKLGCVLRWSDTEPVRILHPSFADFLKIQQRCDYEALYINTHVHNYDAAIRCIHHLHRFLKKNMFNLVLTIMPVEYTFPAATSYACAYWIDHVCMITEVPDIFADTLEQFLVLHLLHWLEAMSLLKKSRMTIALLNRFTRWLQVFLPHRILLNELANDASRFVQTFVSSMEDHPLLIYLSALPFTPVNSLLFQTFADHSTPRISGGYNGSWPPLLQTLSGHDRHIFALAFSPDGTRVASASVDRTIRVWDLSSGISLLTLEGHTDEVFAVAFSADGSQIVSGSADKTVRLWDASSKTDILPALVGHKRMVNAVVFSPDGSRVASGSGDRTIRVWDVTTRSDIFGPLRGHRGSATAVTFTPDGQLLLGAFEHTICSWEMITGVVTAIFSYESHGSVRSLSVSSNGKYVVSGSCSSSIIIWDLATHQIHRRLGGHFPVVHAAFLPGDTRIVSFDETIRLWDIATGEQISTSAKHESMCMAVTREGDRFALASASEVKIMDTSCFYETDLGTIEERGDITTLAFSHDERRFASISEEENDICVWDAETGQACPPLEGQEGTSLTSMVFSPDGNLIVTGLVDTTIIIWNALSGTKLLLLQGHKGAVSCLAFSSDGRRLLSGSGDDTVRLWSLATYDETLHPLVMYGHEEIVSVAFHPDGDQVISGSSEGSIFVWDASSGVPLFKRQVVQRPNTLRSVEYSLNGQLMMISCRYFKDRAPCMVVYTVSNAREADAIMSLAVTPDGWIHKFNTRSVIGKLPSNVSITTYASTSSAIAFVPNDRKSRLSIIHFPPSELTKPGTSSLLESIYCGKTSIEVRNVCTKCGKYCTTYRLKE